MKIGFFSPLPPVRSGIADYSAALLPPLRAIADIHVFSNVKFPGVRLSDVKERREAFDLLLYQMGNNAHHAEIYEQALAEPGVVVLHEGNLHHLHAERTIKRGNWDAYVEGVALDAGPIARAYAERVRRLEVGPDYEGVPMLRKLLESAMGVIVHSDFVAQQVREAGYAGPVEKIWHGAWIDRNPLRTPMRDQVRQRLGLSHSTPLIGVFGFLKPYKRIAESLRAFRRVLRLTPGARMILVGEPHADLDIDNLIRGLGLEESVRVVGYLEREEDFHGYLEAVDVVLNLRYPTVGESSGTLLRALSLGKPVLVSDIGSFREYPDEIVLKVPPPPSAAEEDLIFEYLNALVTRPKLGAALGRRARQWVERECPWELVAERYLDFANRLLGRSVSRPETASPLEVPASASSIEPQEIEVWARDEGGLQYVRTHLTRLTKTLALTPPGRDDQAVLEMGAYMQITPALRFELGYGTVRGCYFGPAGKTDRHEITSRDGRSFICEVDLFDAEKDPFPYPDHSFDTVLCCELLEHLTADPMHMMSEIHRILKPGGVLLLTTPNISSMRALNAILNGYHPSFFPAYILPRKAGEEAEARHNREYTAREIHHLFWESGFEVVKLETGEFLEQPHPEHYALSHLLEAYHFPSELRGDGIYAVGRKTGPIRNRYPNWLYA